MKKNKIKACVVGASGYSGIELVKILLNHPNVELTDICGLNEIGKRLDVIFPSLMGKSDLVFSSVDDVDKNNLDVIFFATPDGVAMKYAKGFIESGVKVIDVSGDFRIKDVPLYEKWYNRKHTELDLLEESVYGLCELFRDEISGARLIANPGCYPTAAQIAIAPILDKGYASSFIVDAKTGITGAGRAASQGNLFGERNECTTPYKIGYKHKHAPEMEIHAKRKTGNECKILFTPQVVPMNWGILETVYAVSNDKVTKKDLVELYKNYYNNEYFIHIHDETLPSTKNVMLTNNVHLGFEVDERTNTLIIVCAIDNLIKGASGQAVQNMNILFGFSEHAGLVL